MKAIQLPTAIQQAYKAGINIMLWGPPGIGKTTIVKQTAALLNLEVVHVHAPLIDLLDMKGALQVQDGTAKFIPLSQWPQYTDKPVIVLIDELPQAVPAIQNGLSQLLLENIMGNISLPPKSLVIGTGNRLEDRAASHRMPSHILNRVLHLTLDIDHESWLTWAVNNGISSTVIGFIKWKPTLLYTFDPNKIQGPYASYRSWTQASSLLDEVLPTALQFDLLAGVLGEGVAVEFMAYTKICSTLPDLDHALATGVLNVPTDVGTLYAIATALAYKVTKPNHKLYFSLVSKLPAEYNVLSVRLALQLNKTLRSTTAFIDWATANANVIL